MNPTLNQPLTDLTRALTAHAPQLQAPAGRPRAAVALVLRPVESDLELLFIERAAHPNDPWSGHIAFPGGRMQPTDPSIRATAERETHEEVGLDLHRARHLGRLDDLSGAVGTVHVAGFVYALDAPLSLQLNYEVVHAFWIPLAMLLEPQRRTAYGFNTGSSSRYFPALDLFGSEHPLLWGLTYRFVALLMGLIGRTLPLEIPPSHSFFSDNTP